MSDNLGWPDSRYASSLIRSYVGGIPNREVSPEQRERWRLEAVAARQREVERRETDLQEDLKRWEGRSVGDLITILHQRAWDIDDGNLDDHGEAYFPSEISDILKEATNG